MIIANGIISPINYSVFTASAASLLLAAQIEYRWSIDHLIAERRAPDQRPTRTTSRQALR
jgi:hypothetical protein